VHCQPLPTSTSSPNSRLILGARLILGGPPCRPDSQPSPDSYPSLPLPPTRSGKASSTIHPSLCYLLTLPEPRLRTGLSTRYIASPFAEPMLVSLQGSLTPAVLHHNIEQHAGTTVSVLSPPTTPSTTSSSAMRVWFNPRIQLDSHSRDVIHTCLA
jgi:hypothetical protein